MIKEYVAIDLETTGLSAKEDKIIEIGAIKVKGGEEKEVFETFINPGRRISERITEVTGISDDMVCNAPYIEAEIEKLTDFIGDLPLLGHNLIFDYSFVKRAAVNNKLVFEKQGIDTLKLARKYLPQLESKKLDYLCKYFNIEDNNHHRAVNDARAAYLLYNVLCEKYGAGEDEAVQLNYRTKRETPVTPKQVAFLKALISAHGIQTDYDIEKLSRNEASRKIDRILSEYGRIPFSQA